MRREREKGTKGGTDREGERERRGEERERRGREREERETQ